jgi:hypothetical protein
VPWPGACGLSHDQGRVDLTVAGRHTGEGGTRWRGRRCSATTVVATRVGHSDSGGWTMRGLPQSIGGCLFDGEERDGQGVL